MKTLENVGQRLVLYIYRPSLC